MKGELHVSDHRDVHPFADAYVDAAVDEGFPRNNDFNGETQEGFGPFQWTQFKGRGGAQCPSLPGKIKKKTKSDHYYRCSRITNNF